MLQKIASKITVPGLHIAEVVCQEMNNFGWRKAGILGTRWTMTGPVYVKTPRTQRYEFLIPEREIRNEITDAIFEEFCQGVFRSATTDPFVRPTDELRVARPDCVILGCTEIPLVITEASSPVSVIDSTRLPARRAVMEAWEDRPVPPGSGRVRRSG